jgi:phosphopantothenoylcysteine decarboxylase
MKILIGMTGSVATTIAPKIVKAIEEVKGAEKVAVVMTEKAQMFMHSMELERLAKVKVYTEPAEWTWFDPTPKDPNEAMDSIYKSGRCQWKKGDPVLHIELAKEYNVLLISPVTANTIAKMANGIVDNLLLSVYAAWRNGPVIIAPAMNSYMYTTTQVQNNLKKLQQMGVLVVPPAIKELACGDVGEGALANVNDIAQAVERYA